MLVFVMIKVLIIMMVLAAAFHWKTAVRVKHMPG